MRVLGLDLTEHAISRSSRCKQRSSDELLALLGNAIAAEERLLSHGALPTEAVAPRAKPKSFKQLGMPTVEAEELAEIELVDLEKL
eukprot:3336209-Pleurochrysis_carterae.AAC.2